MDLREFEGLVAIAGSPAALLRPQDRRLAIHRIDNAWRAIQRPRHYRSVKVRSVTNIKVSPEILDDMKCVAEISGSLTATFTSRNIKSEWWLTGRTLVLFPVTSKERRAAQRIVMDLAKRSRIRASRTTPDTVQRG